MSELIDLAYYLITSILYPLTTLFFGLLGIVVNILTVLTSFISSFFTLFYVLYLFIADFFSMFPYPWGLLVLSALTIIIGLRVKGLLWGSSK